MKKANKLITLALGMIVTLILSGVIFNMDGEETWDVSMQPLVVEKHRVVTSVVTDCQKSLPVIIPPMNTSFEHLINDSISVQQKYMCDVKYPLPTVNMLRRTLTERGVRRVAIIANLKDCLYMLPSLEKAIMQVADVLSPENVFVSILESGSNDKTPSYLYNMSIRLQARGVSNVISTGSNRISQKWKPGEYGERIRFLAGLRNAAVAPALDGHPVGHFDKFFFINDVFMCGGDILRLLAHDADIACGLDFAANRNIYDFWVFATYDDAHVAANTEIKNVLVCWNGGAAIRAVLWYQGMRFRRGMPDQKLDDCSNSECSLWNLDAHRMGYHNIVLDPTIQVAYIWPDYVNSFFDSSPEVKGAVLSPKINSNPYKLDLKNLTYRCCEHEHSGRDVAYAECHYRFAVSNTNVVCKENPSKCLRYPPGRWEGSDWDWKPLLKQGVL